MKVKSFDLLKRTVLIFTATWSALVLSQLSGCASGGFKMTRSYARWVNSTPIILRIVLYLLTGIVFVVTQILDLVIFNTLDFWNGTVSAGHYQFEKEGRLFQVEHSNEHGLRRTVISVFRDQKQEHQYRIQETPEGKIELYQGEVLHTRVDHLDTLPMITTFALDGKTVQAKSLLVTWTNLVAQKNQN